MEEDEPEQEQVQVPLLFMAPEEYQRQLALRRLQEAQAAAKGGQGQSPPRYPSRLPPATQQLSQSAIFARPPPPPTQQQQQQQWSQSTIFGRPPTQQQRSQSTVFVRPLQQQQQGFGFGGGGAGAAAATVVRSPRVMAAPGPRLAMQQHQPTILAPPQQQIAHEDALKACNPDFKTPFVSVEDAISRLLPYHVFAEYEEDEIYVEDQPPVKNKSSVEEWDDFHEAEAVRMAEELEKQVLGFNVTARKLAASRAEERFLVENLLLADEQLLSERVRAVVRQRQVVALQQQQQQQRQRMLQQRAQQQKKLMLEHQQQGAVHKQPMLGQRQQQQRQPPVIMRQGHPLGGGTIPIPWSPTHPDAMDALLVAYAEGGLESVGRLRQQHRQSVKEPPREE